MNAGNEAVTYPDPTTNGRCIHCVNQSPDELLSAQADFNRRFIAALKEPLVQRALKDFVLREIQRANHSGDMNK